VNEKIVSRVVVLARITLADDVVPLAVIVPALVVKLVSARAAEPNGLSLLVETSDMATMRLAGLSAQGFARPRGSSGSAG
jgi:hypothetical protein